MNQLGVLVLAAGLSRRMEGPNKLLMPWRAQPMISHVLECAHQIRCLNKVLVCHRNSAEIRALLPDPSAWICLDNDAAASGLASSLRLGLSALGTCQAVLVLLGDMPDVAPATIDALLAVAKDMNYAAVPVLGDQWGNPVVLSRNAMDDCATLTGDQGARSLLKSNQDRVIHVVVDDPAILRDFDDPRDFVSDINAADQ